MEKLKIIFMGTPDFAVPSLTELVKQGMDVRCVCTQTDKPVGRKQVLTPSDVKKAALDLGLNVYQPATLKSDEAFEYLSQFNADFIVVAAYGKILPKRILDLPKYACVNLHGSLLPKYRGASPIQRAVLAGEKKTGVTSMLMAEGLDTGDILKTVEYEIGENDTSGEVFDRLAEMSAPLLMETLDGIVKGEITPIKQSDNDSTYAAMLSKQEAELDFTRSMAEEHNFVRGMNPWPVAFTEFGGKKLKIYETRKSEIVSSRPVGSFFQRNRKMFVVCGDGHALEIISLQAEGSKRMSADAFLSGHAIDEQ